MAKKSLILDNGDGRVTFSNTASVSLDDGADNNMSASFMTASSLSISGLGVGQVKLLSASNGTFNIFSDGTVDGGAIAFDGTRWVTSSLLVQDYSGSAYGDLSGTYESGVQVVNISNVNAGTLPVAFGGTGRSLASSQALILKVSASAGQTPVISALSASSGSVLTTYGGAWTAIPPGYPDVRFYTSGSTGNTFTWNKPSGARFARIILQGAGGGGGGFNVSNGGGGGSGGFTDITIDLAFISTLLVTASLGGNGSVSSAGSNGGATYVGRPTSPTEYYANGGVGGGVNSALPTAGGTGITKNGGAGAGANGTAAETVYGMPSGGGRGAGAAGTVVHIISNKNFGYHITYDGIDISTSLIAASGSAGASTSIPVRPGYGAGGGGGVSGYAGGPGGHGYALIISW